MAAETELRELIASRREGVLGTIKRGGLAWRSPNSRSYGSRSIC